MDRVFPRAAFDALQPPQVHFAPGEERAIFITYEGKVFSVDLVGTSAPVLLAQDVTGADLSADRTTIKWTSAEGLFIMPIDGSSAPRRVPIDSKLKTQLSPSGRYLLLRTAKEWQLLDTKHLERAPVPLVGSVHVYMDFDPSERLVVGSFEPTYANYLSLWKLDAPSVPHHILTDGEVGRLTWMPAVR